MKETKIILQARTQSTRYPQKILQPFFNNKTILDIVIETCKSNALNVQVVLATTDRVEDNILREYSERHDILFFQGSEQDVLGRFIACSHKFGAKYVLRVCSDNPFLAIDPINELLENSASFTEDYLSYCNYNNIPAIKTHLGIYAELVSVEALERVDTLTANMYYHEHVTNYIYSNLHAFNVRLFPVHAAVYYRDDIRLTCDTPQDFDMLKLLYALYLKEAKTKKIYIDKLMAIIDAQPELKASMRIGIDMFKK